MTLAIRPHTREQVIHLKTSWEAYHALSNGISEDSHTLLAYDGETLELMSPGPTHEFYANLISDLLAILMAEWEINLLNTGSTRFDAEPIGFEADKSYYIANASKVDQLEKIDLTRDPPPDLVVEVDITHRRMDKQRLYANLGVKEFWRYGSQGFEGFTLDEGDYSRIEISVVIPGLPLAELAAFLKRHSKSNRLAVIKDWQRWLRANQHLHRP